MKDKSCILKDSLFKNALRFCPTEWRNYQTQNAQNIWGCQILLFLPKTRQWGIKSLRKVCWSLGAPGPGEPVCPTEHSVPFLDQWDGQRRPRGVWEWEEEFITKPHLYSSPTSLSSSLQCQREKILSSRVLETCLTRRELTQDTPLSCLPTLLGKHELLYTFISLLFIGGRSLPIMEMKVLCGKQTQSIIQMYKEWRWLSL